MERRPVSPENPFRSNLLLILSEEKHREIFSRSSLSPSGGSSSCYVGSTDSYRRVCLAISNELLKLGVVMTAKPMMAVCTYQSPDTLTQALQSISAPSQFVVSSVNLENEVKGSTIAAGYRDDGLALKGAYNHYMSGAHQLIIFSDCLEEVDSKWGYLLGEASRMYDEVIIVNPDCLRKNKVELADLRQAKMFGPEETRQEWSISLVSDFILPSEEEILAKLGSIKEAEAWRKAQEEKRQQDELAQKKEKAREKLGTLLAQSEVSAAVENCLLEMLTREKELWGASVLDSDTVALVSGRSEWGSSGGIGYHSQAVMVFRGQQQTKEWCYRDRYDSRKDNWDLCIEKIGQIQSKANGETIVFRVELINNGKSRWTEFSFAFKLETAEAPALSSAEQLAFRSQVEGAIESLLKAKEERWIGQPEMLRYCEIPTQLMPGESIYVQYQKPALQQKLVLESSGLAAFVLVEQIDHRLSDPQLRYELYSLKSGQQKSALLFEDHSYDRAEGSAMISIVDLNGQKVKARTREGVREIDL